MSESKKVMRLRFGPEPAVLNSEVMYWTPIFYSQGENTVDPVHGERETWYWYAQGRYEGTVGRDVWLAVCNQIETVLLELGLRAIKLEKKLHSFEFSAEVVSDSGESLKIECEWVTDERLFEYRSAYAEVLESFENKPQFNRIRNWFFPKTEAERRHRNEMVKEKYVRSRPNPSELETGPVLSIQAQVLSRKSSLRPKLDDLTQALLSAEMLKDAA